MKIGFLSAKNPLDRGSWSGTMFYMYNALKDYAGEVEIIGAPRPLSIRLMWHWINSMRKLFGQRLGIMQSVPLSMAYSLFYEKKLKESTCDVIFAPIAATEIGYVKTSIPVFYMSDTTFCAQENYYYQASEISSLGRWEGNLLERRTIQQSDVLIYSNAWATESAIRDYGANPAKIHVVPFGANLDTVPDRKTLSGGSTDGKCRLLFVSRDWKRKGGQIAYDALLALREKNIDAELTVVGCIPSPALEHPHLQVIPFLNKKIDADRLQMEELYRHADFFLLPTRAECSAIVFCEASAYALPTISTQTGGVSTVIEEGSNGFLLPLDALGDDYAEAIARIWAEPARYQELRRTTRERYDSLLNWKVWAETIRDLMKDHLDSKTAK